MSVKQRKILFAAVDVGYRIENYVKFIQENFPELVKADSLTIYSVPGEHYKTTYTYQYDFNNRSIVYRRLKAFQNFVRCLFKYDTVHFISGETLLPRKMRGFELGTYRLFGKRIIMHFVGSDIRDENYLRWKTKNLHAFLSGTTNQAKTKPWQDKLIQQSVKYAHRILVSTPDLKELIPSAEYYPVVLDLEKFNAELAAVPEPKNLHNTIRILHSPSSKTNNLKGSEYIYPILEKIKEKSLNVTIELIFPERLEKERPTSYPATRYEMFELYKRADIIIDQIVIGWYGLLAIEGLAAGKKVISYADKELHTYLYENNPIVMADITTLEECVLNCIDEIKKGKTEAKEQINWVKKYHTIENNHSALLHAWNLNKTN